MPELPEIETLVLQLQKKLSGKTISSLEILGQEILKNPAALLRKKISGRKINSGINFRKKKLSTPGNFQLAARHEAVWIRTDHIFIHFLQLFY